MSLHIGDTAPNFTIDTTKGKIDFHGKTGIGNRAVDPADALLAAEFFDQMHGSVSATGRHFRIQQKGQMEQSATL